VSALDEKPFDPNHPHRQDNQECPPYDCKAGKRPIPKEESQYKPFVLDHCHTMGAPWMKKEYTKFADPLGGCCFMKDVCLATCGMPYEQCHKHYWKCAESTCEAAVRGEDARSGNQNRLYCEEFAKYNDNEQIFFDRKAKDKSKHEDAKKSVCPNFKKLQREACDCVPAGEFDRAWKKRIENFWVLHDPSMLNKKGEIKDKKLYASWKGRRSEMFKEMMLFNNVSMEILARPDPLKGAKLPDDFYDDDDPDFDEPPKEPLSQKSRSGGEEM